MSQIHHDHRRWRVSTHPPGLFPAFVENKSRTVNRPLGGPCATLGWPLGGPRATQGPSNPRPNPKSAEGRKPKKPWDTTIAAPWGCFSQLPRANYQEPLLSSFLCQRSSNAPLFRSGANFSTLPFVRLCQAKSWLSGWKNGPQLRTLVRGERSELVKRREQTSLPRAAGRRVARSTKRPNSNELQSASDFERIWGPSFFRGHRWALRLRSGFRRRSALEKC